MVRVGIHEGFVTWGAVKWLQRHLGSHLPYEGAPTDLVFLLTSMGYRRGCLNMLSVDIHLVATDAKDVLFMTISCINLWVIWKERCSTVLSSTPSDTSATLVEIWIILLHTLRKQWDHSAGYYRAAEERRRQFLRLWARTSVLFSLHEKRERLVKASRDVTMNSKKVIFQVHRLNLESKESALQQAEIDLAKVKMDHVSRIAKELQGSDFWKFRRAYSPGMQEYVEAAAFLEFCKTGRLLTMDDLNESFKELRDASYSDFKLNLQDYLLGVGDLTGELMRLAISNVTDGDLDSAKSICNFVRSLYVSLSLIANEVDDTWDMKQKMEVMLQSVMKIETTCYTIHVRGSEYFPGAAAAEDINSEQREEA